MKAKVTKDGFIWLVVKKKTAIALFENEDTEIYKLYEDDSEAAIENLMDFQQHNGEFGIELGNIKDLCQYRTDYRNNRFGFGLESIIIGDNEESLSLIDCNEIHTICHKICSILSDDEIKKLFYVNAERVIKAIKGYDEINKVLNE